MNKEKLMYELESSIEKAIHLVNNTIDSYNLEDEYISLSQDDALAFALDRPNIYMNMNIIFDYLRWAKAVAEKLTKEMAWFILISQLV